MKNVKTFDEFNDSLNEKWKDEAEIKSTGEYADKTIEELEEMKAKLKKKEVRTDKESTKLRQINFAIRAKRKWKGGA